MKLYLITGGIAGLSILSLFFSCLTYSLRNFSRPRLAEYLGQHEGDQWYDELVDHAVDLAYLTAVGRQLCNILLWLGVFALMEIIGGGIVFRYGLTLLIAGVITVLVAVTLPGAAAKYAGAEIVGFFAPTLHYLRLIFAPAAGLMHGADNLVRGALGVAAEPAQEQMENQILSAVEEGEKEGVVGEQQREMIESVIEFRDTTAGQIMTPRTQMSAVEAGASLDEVRRVIEDSGFSRLPVYEGSLDHIVGILFARDLIKYLGRPSATTEPFAARTAMRPANFVPELKPLRDLLDDFRAQKSHIAIVLDEYGSVAGLVTIEDVLEELVGEISDEHEKTAPALIRRIDDRVVEADGRANIAEFNRILGTHLPEEAGYDTLGGFLGTSLGRIPAAGAVYEHDGIRYTILSAEPQRINRVKIELKLPGSEPTRQSA